MSGLDNSQLLTDEASLHAEVIHHEHHGERAHVSDPVFVSADEPASSPAEKPEAKS